MTGTSGTEPGARAHDGRSAACFGAPGLALAAIGLYGLLSYTVARRTNEIGIRLALGAERRRVLWIVIRDVLLLLATGIVIGIPAAEAASHYVSSLLFGLTASDALTIAAAAVLLAATGILAGFVPDWRASRVDPVVALRYEWRCLFALTPVPLPRGRLRAEPQLPPIRLSEQS